MRASSLFVIVWGAVGAMAGAKAAAETVVTSDVYENLVTDRDGKNVPVTFSRVAPSATLPGVSRRLWTESSCRRRWTRPESARRIRPTRAGFLCSAHLSRGRQSAYRLAERATA